MKKIDIIAVFAVWFVVVNLVITVIAELPDCIQMAIMIVSLWSFLPLYQAVMSKEEES